MSGRLRPKESLNIVLSFNSAAYQEFMQEIAAGSMPQTPQGLTSSSSSQNILRGFPSMSSTSSGSNSQFATSGREFQAKLLRGSKSTSNVEALIVIQYMSATSKNIVSEVDTKGEIVLEDGSQKSVLMAVDKLIIPIAYEVYHEV